MSQLTLCKNSSGFTLIEVMVAIVIIMVGMLGLLEALSVSMQHNLKNQLRTESLRVGERYMAELRGRDFDTSLRYIAYTTVTAPSKVRGTAKNYSIERSSQVIANDDSGATSRQLTVAVKYLFRNQTTVNQAVSVVARP